MKRLAISLLIVGLLGCKSGGPPSAKGPKDAGAIVVGLDPTTPPFESLDQQTNRPVGFDIDVMNQISVLIGRKLDYRTADFKTFFEGLKTNQFDLVISAVTITDERKKVVSFSDPYVDIAQIVVARTNDSRIKIVQDLSRNAKVGVQTGTTGENLLLSDGFVKDNNLRRYDNVSLALADLKGGAIDAVVDDQPILLSFLSTSEFSGLLTVIGPLTKTESYGIVLKKGDSALLSQINAAIATLKSNGTIDRLAIKYHLR